MRSTLGTAPHGAAVRACAGRAPAFRSAPDMVFHAPAATSCVAFKNMQGPAAHRLHAVASPAERDLGSQPDAGLHRQTVQAALDLQQRGWAVVEGVIPEEECDAYVDGFWNWAESLETGVKRDDPGTWRAPAWPPSYRGIINSLEVAHQAWVWKIRKSPRLLQVFEHLWGSAALLSSFDSINALPPTAHPPARAWLHVDQAPWRRGAACIQGLVNMVPVSGATTGTLLVKDGTHLQHEHFFTQISKMSPEQQRAVGDFYQFTDEELAHWEPFRSVAVEGGRGSLFLWDSRTVHANAFPQETSSMRHVVYCCYQPAAMATEADLAEKQRAFQGHFCTTHWPAMNVKLYDKEQATAYYGAKAAAKLPKYQVQRTRAEVEDRRLLQLAGVVPYGTTAEGRERRPLMGMSEQELGALLE